MNCGCNNNGGCWWIIILILIFFCCGNGCGGYTFSNSSCNNCNTGCC